MLACCTSIKQFFVFGFLGLGSSYCCLGRVVAIKGAPHCCSTFSILFAGTAAAAAVDDVVLVVVVVYKFCINIFTTFVTSGRLKFEKNKSPRNSNSKKKKKNKKN